MTAATTQRLARLYERSTRGGGVEEVVAAPSLHWSVMTSTPRTCLDREHGYELIPSRTRLLFAELISHGPGFSESLEYRIGPTKCGGFDVLWVKSDWIEDGHQLLAVVWLPRHELRGRALHLVLLKAWLSAEREVDGATEAPFNEVESRRGALLSDAQVFETVDSLFGKSDSSEA